MLLLTSSAPFGIKKWDLSSHSGCRRSAAQQHGRHSMGKRRVSCSSAARGPDALHGSGTSVGSHRTAGDTSPPEGDPALLAVQQQSSTAGDDDMYHDSNTIAIRLRSASQQQDRCASRTCETLEQLHWKLYVQSTCSVLRICGWRLTFADALFELVSPSLSSISVPPAGGARTPRAPSPFCL